MTKDDGSYDFFRFLSANYESYLNSIFSAGDHLFKGKQDWKQFRDILEESLSEVQFLHCEIEDREMLKWELIREKSQTKQITKKKIK